MNPTADGQPLWRRLGEIDLSEWGSEATFAQARALLAQSIHAAASLDEMWTPIENAITNALARKSASRIAECVQSLVISCLAPPVPEEREQPHSPGWSFFLIERPATTQAEVRVEVIELCLYNE